jgi:hypothetical protein
MPRPRPAARSRICSGERGQEIRSFSKISTPSNPAAAIAASFSVRVPLTETVAMHLRMPSSCMSRRSMASAAGFPGVRW